MPRFAPKFSPHSFVECSSYCNLFFRVHRSTVQKKRKPQELSETPGWFTLALWHWLRWLCQELVERFWFDLFKDQCVCFLVPKSFLMEPIFFGGDLTWWYLMSFLYCSHSWFIIMTWYHKIEVMVSFSTLKWPHFNESCKNQTFLSSETCGFQWTCIIAVVLAPIFTKHVGPSGSVCVDDVPF